MQTLRFAIIGCGMVAKWHAEAIQAAADAELAAVCSRDHDQAKAFADEYGVSAVYTDCQDLFAATPVDAVSICVPSGLHGHYAEACARAGKHILCEKPLDISRAAMDGMLKAAADYGVKLQVAFQSRMRPGLQRAKAVLDSGELGRMLIVECQYRGYRSPEYYASATWRGTKALDGGGCLMNQGIHVIDTMCWLAGDPVSVYGRAETMLRDIEVEDTASALVEFASGAQGVLMGTVLSHYPEAGPEGDRLRIECEQGSIVYANGSACLYRRGDDGVEEVSLEDEGHEAASSAEDPAAMDVEGHKLLVEDLVEAVQQDRPVYIPGESARKSVDLVLALYESSASGKRCYLQS